MEPDVEYFHANVLVMIEPPYTQDKKHLLWEVYELQHPEYIH